MLCTVQRCTRTLPPLPANTMPSAGAEVSTTDEMRVYEVKRWDERRAWQAGELEASRGQCCAGVWRPMDFICLGRWGGEAQGETGEEGAAIYAVWVSRSRGA